MFKDYLDQLVKARHLKEFVVGQTSGNQGNAFPPPLGIIEVIHATFIGISISRRKGILSVTLQRRPEARDFPEKRLRPSRKSITFGDDDIEGMS